MYIRQRVCEHKSAFAFVTLTLHVNVQDLASVVFICTKSEAACLHANVAVQMCSEAHSPTGPTCQCILPLLFDLSKGHSVSCVPQAPFPFNSCGIILGLMWRCTSYNLLSVQQGKCASLAYFICWIHIIIKMWFSSTFFLCVCFTLCAGMLSKVRLSHALTVNFLVIITSEIWSRGSDVRAESMLWKGNDVSHHINAYQIVRYLSCDETLCLRKQRPTCPLIYMSFNRRVL